MHTDDEVFNPLRREKFRAARPRASVAAPGVSGW